MKQELLDSLDFETLRQMVTNCSCYDGSLQEYEYFENGEWFFKEWFSDAWKAVQMVCNGDYNSLDDYVQFDYDCLNSYTELEVKDTLEDNKEEIFDNWYDLFLENNVNYDYYSDEFKELVDKYKEEQEND